MQFKFDHLVHFTDKPEDTKEELKALGLHVVDGGRHEDGGTYNTLTYFDLSYIELIGVFDRKLAESDAEKYSLRDTFQKNHFEDGMSKVAFRSDNLCRDRAYFESLGLEVHGPLPLSRERPDGSVLSWKLLYIGDGEDHLGLPFFIEWGEPDDARREDLTEQKTLGIHERGALYVDSVGMAVKDSEATMKKWASYFNLVPGEVFYDASLAATGHRLNLGGGDIVFYTPDKDGVVSRVLNDRGETPFMVDIGGAEDQGQFEVKNGLYRFI